MEYSSSEDDELIENYIDLEDDMSALDVDHGMSIDVPFQLHEHVENSIESIDYSISKELTAIDGDVAKQDPFLGMEFESDTSARNFYNAYAMRLGFGIRVARSRSERRKGVEVLVMKRFVCLKEGHHKKKVTEFSTKKKRKRLSIRDGCPAMLEVVRRGPERWVVTKLVTEHTHVVVSPERARQIQLNNLSGKDREHDNYLREMRQKIFGEGDAQGLLEYFKKIQAMNSGFFYAMQVDDRNCMTNVFWADAKARMAYNYFGDAVTFDTSYKKNEHMMPIALFTGVNHHGQAIIFGCALVIDNTESSYAWLFETWLTAMCGRHPISLTTDQGKAMGGAVAKVFPNTRHRLCKRRILSRCKKMLPDIHSRYSTFHGDLKKCVNESDTAETFETWWKSILDKYELMENTWMQLLYNARQKWIPAYLKDSFFAEMSTTQRPESMNKLFRSHIIKKTSLLEFIAKLDQDMDSQYEKEVEEDFATLHAKHILKTDSPMEKQAAEIYTQTVFDSFQEELSEALDHYAVKIEEGAISRYSVVRDGDARATYIVTLNDSQKRAICSCYKFEFSGILCRHVLGVFLVTGVNLLPEHYILKRWTRKAKSGLLLDECGVEIRRYCQNSPILRYNDLFRDAIKCAEKGATSAETYKVAKDMLQKAFAEIVGLEENAAKGAHHQPGST